MLSFNEQKRKGDELIMPKYILLSKSNNNPIRVVLRSKSKRLALKQFKKKYSDRVMIAYKVTR